MSNAHKLLAVKARGYRPSPTVLSYLRKTVYTPSTIPLTCQQCRRVTSSSSQPTDGPTNEKKRLSWSLRQRKIDAARATSTDMPSPYSGNLAGNPLLEDEDRERAADRYDAHPSQAGGKSRMSYGLDKPMEMRGIPKGMKFSEVPVTAGDPDPLKRLRRERRTIVHAIRTRARLSKADKLSRSERSHLSKSPFLKTSIKKLMPLARQIAGKPLLEAMIQMRFSKKKAATFISKQLEYARDQAMFQRRMGMRMALPTPGNTAQDPNTEAGMEEDVHVTIRDRKGKRRVIRDPSAMYVDEAWVGRGKFTNEVEYRARGKRNILRHPTTSISILLKEERTRLRLAEEKEAKRQRKATWVQLPHRPINAQRQYLMW